MRRRILSKLLSYFISISLKVYETVKLTLQNFYVVLIHYFLYFSNTNMLVEQAIAS